MKYAISLAAALLLNASANLLMKVGMNRVETAGGWLKAGSAAALKTVLTSPILLTGLVCFALNAAFYMFALQSKALKISIAYPVMVGGGYAIIATVAYLLLRERLTIGQWIGVVMIVVGVIVVAVQTPASPLPGVEPA
jgi:small multidrug resistance pump